MSQRLVGGNFGERTQGKGGRRIIGLGRQQDQPALGQGPDEINIRRVHVRRIAIPLHEGVNDTVFIIGQRRIGQPGQLKQDAVNGRLPRQRQDRHPALGDALAEAYRLDDRENLLPTLPLPAPLGVRPGQQPFGMLPGQGRLAGPLPRAIKLRHETLDEIEKLRCWWGLRRTAAGGKPGQDAGQPHRQQPPCQPPASQSHPFDHRQGNNNVGFTGKWLYAELCCGAMCTAAGPASVEDGQVFLKPVGGS